MREIRTCCSMSRSVIVLTCIDIGFLLLNFVMCSGIGYCVYPCFMHKLIIAVPSIVIVDFHVPLK